MHIYVKNTHAKFHLDPICFKRSPQGEEEEEEEEEEQD